MIIRLLGTYSMSFAQGKGGGRNTPFTPPFYTPLVAKQWRRDNYYFLFSVTKQHSHYRGCGSARSLLEYGSGAPLCVFGLGSGFPSSSEMDSFFILKAGNHDMSIFTFNMVTISNIALLIQNIEGIRFRSSCRLGKSTDPNPKTCFTGTVHRFYMGGPRNRLQLRNTVYIQRFLTFSIPVDCY